MKRICSIVLCLTLILVQLTLVPSLASGITSPDKIATYTKASYNAGTKGYTLSSVVVDDNKYFTSAIEMSVSDGTLFNSTATRDPAIYVGDNATQSIKAWTENGDAQVRFFIKTPHAFTATLRFQHSYSGSYNNATYPLSVNASDKWQEIRIKRSEFTASANFNTALNSAGSVNLQLIIPKNTFLQGEGVVLSPIEFYNGELITETDPMGGTIDTSPKPGNEIAIYDSIGYRASSKPYTTAVEAVGDNKNFTSAVSLVIDDQDAYNTAGGDAVMYAETKADADIYNWAKSGYAEMRFWILVPHEVTFTVRLQHYHSSTGYNNAAYKITVPASDKWQEIRIKRSDFTASGTFNDAVAGDGKVSLQLLTDKNATDFMLAGEKLYMSPVIFYDGYIEEEIDPDGGTISITPAIGNVIANFDNKAWNSDGKGYSVTEEAVADNKYFTNSVALKITDESVYNSRGGDAALYAEKINDVSIKDWADKPFAEMQFFIKVPHSVTFTLRIIHSSENVYTKITHKLTVPASDKWQEIRIAREEFTGDAAFNDVIDKEGSINIQILTDKNATDFMSQDEKLLVSPVNFYDGYIEGEPDSEGGTVSIPDIYGKKIASVPSVVVKELDGAKLQLVSVYDNDFVSKALKFTLTDKDVFYGNKTQINTNGLTAPADLSDWYDYQKAEMRFFVKVPHSMKFRLQIVERIGNIYPYIETAIEIGSNTGWQQVKIPRSAFTSNSNFTGENIQYIRLLPMDYETTDGYLDFCESLIISQVEFFDGIIPKSADTVNKGKSGKLIHTFNLFPYVGNGTLPEVVAVNDNANFKTAVATKIGEVRTVNAGEGSHVIHNDKVVDISAWHKNPNAELRFWVRSAKDLVLKFGLQNAASKDASSYRAIWAQISIKGSDGWQEIRLSTKHFSETAGFDPSRIKYIKVLGSGDETITTNEIFFISNIEVYDGTITKAIDKNGGTTSNYKENAIIATFSSFDIKNQNNKLEISELEINTNKHFTIGYEFKASANTSLDTVLKTYYDTYDISRAKNGTLRLWVKTAKAVAFNVVLKDKAGNTITLPFESQAKADKWQELRAELKNASKGKFDFTRLFSVSVTGELANKVSLQIGKMELWKNILATAVDSSGGQVEPPLVLPPVWKDLPLMPADEENRILVNTSNSDFWTGDWNDTSRPRSFAANNRGLDKKDINYIRFKIYKELSVVDSSVYYKNPTPAMFYFRKVTDITPYLKTGTLRFWVNVPKNMSLKITLQSIDEDNKYSFATVVVDVRKTDKDNGFCEIQIPLKRFYDAAVKAGAAWNPYFVKNLLIGGIDGCNANTFLKEGELLNVSQFEIWKAEALEPEPFDPTRIFYSLHGDIFIKDVDDVLSKTAMVSAYRNTLNKEKYKKISEKYYGGTLLDNYTIQLISAGQYDYNIVTAYDEVKVYVPVTDSLNKDGLIIAVYNNQGIFECEYELKDGYFVITTKQFGEYLFIDGGKRNETQFNYNIDMKDIFGFTSQPDSVIPVSVQKNTTLVLIIVSIAVILFAAIATVVIIILKKKGIISGKGKV